MIGTKKSNNCIGTSAFRLGSLSLWAVLTATLAATGEIAAAETAPVDTRTPLWVLTEGVDTPESAYIDAGSGFIYVSMIVGSPMEKDGNGRIAKLTLDGKVVSMSWVSGLNAPKGLRSYNGTLWTADIDGVVSIEIATGRVTARIKVPNARMLNDLACGLDGTVYVSDTIASTIYAIKDGQVTIFAQGEDLEYPNGVLVEQYRLIVGGWGKPPTDPTATGLGRLFALDLKTAKRTAITPKPIANIDGVESDGRGGWYLSDNPTGKILHVSPTGEVLTVAEVGPGAADISYSPTRRILVVPYLSGNKVSAFDLGR